MYWGSVALRPSKEPSGTHLRMIRLSGHICNSQHPLFYLLLPFLVAPEMLSNLSEVQENGENGLCFKWDMGRELSTTEVLKPGTLRGRAMLCHTLATSSKNFLYTSIYVMRGLVLKESDV